MQPSEVEGHLKTFNYYLRLPESMWPEIKKAEDNPAQAEGILNNLRNHVLNCK